MYNKSANLKIKFLYFSLLKILCHRACVLAIQRDRGKMRNHPLGGMTTPQSLLLHFLLKIFGTHAHAPGMIFQVTGFGTPTMVGHVGVQSLNHYPLLVLNLFLL